MKTFRIIAAIIAAGLASSLLAQTTGGIKGTITDDKGQGLPFISVALMEDATIVSGIITDDKGDFTFKQLTPGSYNLQFSFFGYRTKKVQGVGVDPDRITYVYKTLSPDTLTTVEIVEIWEPSIIDPTYSTMTRIDIERIENIPMEKGDIVGLITAVTPAVVSSENGRDVHIRGARVGTTAYYVDGNKMFGPPQVAGTTIGQVEVLTGGMPAEYGDCIGGVVIITTKDYEWEMRRKEMARAARKEREERKKKQKN